MINFYKSHSKKAVTPVALKKTKHKIFFTFLLFFLLHNMCFGQIKVTLDNMGQNTCPGGSSGVINITVSGGTGTYVTTWNDNILTEDRNSLSQGTYFVTVTDGVNPAVVSPNFLITDPDPFTTTDITTAVSCFGESDGSSIITVTGGTPPYNSFKWYKSTNVIAGQEVSTTQNLVGKPGGTYRVFFKDSKNCGGQATVIIPSPAKIVVKEIPGSHVDNVEFGLSNGVISLDVTGGTPAAAPNEYTYIWTKDGNPISLVGKFQAGLESGKYTVVAKDANGCESAPYLTTIEPLAELKLNPTSVNSTCKASSNGSINLNVTGGKTPYSVKWADLPNPITSTTRTGLDKGTYSATLTDALGATRNIAPIVIDAPELLVFPPVSSTNNKCFLDNNGTITINNVSGGIAPYSYILNGGTPVTFTGNSVVISNLASGSYIVTIKDKGTCANTPSQSVDILPLKALGYQKPPLVTQVTCLNDKSGAINVFIEGGQKPYQYKWSNDTNLNSADNPNLQEGNYTLEVTDAFGCLFTSPTAIPVTRDIVAVSLTKDAQTNNVCFNDKNGSATFSISGGTPNYTANWTYEGKTTTLIDNDLSQNKIIVKNLPSGRYTLMVVDQKGCTSTTLTIDITPFKLYTNPEITNITCKGNNDAFIEVKPSGGTPDGYSTTWTSVQFTSPQTNKTKIGPLSPGTYKLEILNGICPFDTTFIVSPATPITQVEIIKEKANVCIADSANGSARIKVKGGVPPYTSFQFSLMDPVTGLPVALAPTVIDPNFPDVAINNALLPGTYFLTVIDQNSCPSVLPQFTILPNNCDPSNDKIIVDPLMSPNGDGQGNEFFYINKIEDYPENEVVIYNRWGMEVFTIRGYDNKDRVFTGLANSALTNRNEVLVDGVYYYTIRSVMDKKQKVNKGYIIIKR